MKKIQAGEKTWIEISRKNLRHNLGVFRALCGRATPIWVVKADAYGHGAALVAKEIAKTIKKGRGEWFGVDSIDEAVFLRQQGIGAPVIVLGYVPPERLHDLVKYDLRFLLTSFASLAEIKKRKLKLRVHLKIDTGTSRQGIFPEEAFAFARAAKEAGQIIEGCSTHFANIEDTESPTYADLQMERFVHVVSLLQASGLALPMVHAACSAAVLTRPETVMTATRVGIGLYGLYPSEYVKKAARTKKLLPVLSWKTRVSQVKTLSAGTPVGYGLTERTKKKTLLAVIPIGYADGFPRAASGKGMVLVGGKRCRVMGRVCMNMLMVDASGTKVAPGDEAVIIGGEDGKRLPIEILAKASDSINYEIVARISARIKRFLV